MTSPIHDALFAKEYAALKGRDGFPASLLERVHALLRRFIVYPSDHDSIAHTLWVAHTHLMDAWESTPRLAFLSPEPSSGKTRALEITETMVPRPVEAINTTPAFLFRKVSDPAGMPTILYDEVDAIFGPRAKAHEDVRAIINAGHRRGAKAGRCITGGKRIRTEELPAYCAVALAGIGNLPDTILSRSIVIAMRRRAPHEPLEPYRRRVHAPEGNLLREFLARWTTEIKATMETCPKMPDGIADRNADMWEPLLALADAAGGGWPARARVAAVALVAAPMGKTASLGVRLLRDLKTVLNGREALPTAEILVALHSIEESPWGDLRGKPLDPLRLSNILRPYNIHSGDVRIGEKVLKGYTAEKLHDAWLRYLPEGDGGGHTVSSPLGATPATPATEDLLPDMAREYPESWDDV